MKLNLTSEYTSFTTTAPEYIMVASGAVRLTLSDPSSPGFPADDGLVLSAGGRENGSNFIRIAGERTVYLRAISGEATLIREALA